ncbi:hypothetical protein [Listeria phage LP-KV022]|uniref:Transmembrane protein n=2 Tax=Homburgvirus LP110 TaxID=1921128 RepID=A0A5A4K356_9CAUD|nr:hypothetical protein LP110_025 [Listeria phage LP-110]AGI11528.1 hypothetical protein LP110_025 [Listeria phage LP-110]AWY07719.1 hypothetical protein [Listeria phage LP-KV022]
MTDIVVQILTYILIVGFSFFGITNLIAGIKNKGKRPAYSRFLDITTGVGLLALVWLWFTNGGVS